MPQPVLTEIVIEDEVALPETITLTPDSTFVETENSDSTNVERNKATDVMENDAVTTEEPIKNHQAE